MAQKKLSAIATNFISGGVLKVKTANMVEDIINDEIFPFHQFTVFKFIDSHQV